MQTGVGRVKKPSGELTENDEETPEEICRYFTNVFKKENGPFDAADTDNYD